MKTIIYFETEELSFRQNICILEHIRLLYRDEPIIMVSAGDFSSCGTLLAPSGRERAAGFVKAGADLVLSLPTASVLGGYGKKEFAGAALIQRLRVNEQLVIPCVPVSGQTVADCEKALHSLAMLMFRAEPDYRSRLTNNLDNNMPFRDAQLRAICGCVPEAADLLTFPVNRHALWLLDAMLQLYYMANVEFIAAPALKDDENSPASDACVNHSSDRYNKTALGKAAEHFEKTAAAKTVELAADASFEDLIDIAGSTTQMVTSFFENKERIKTAGSFEQIVQILQPGAEDSKRLFLLKAVLGLRKIYMQICGLHVYVPYCFVSAFDPDKAGFLRKMEEISWVPLIIDNNPEQTIKDDYYYLLQADKKAADLEYK